MPVRSNADVHVEAIEAVKELRKRADRSIEAEALLLDFFKTFHSLPDGDYLVDTPLREWLYEMRTIYDRVRDHFKERVEEVDKAT